MGQIFSATTETTVARKELVAYLNTGTSQAPVWTAIGWHCTDASMSVEVDTDTQKDILGNVFTNASTPELTQDFDPLPIRRVQQGSDNALQQLLHNQWMSQDFSGTYDTLIVYLYAGTGSPGTANCQYDAHHFPASTIVPGDFGGSAEDPLNRAITVYYGGTVEVGTATINPDTGVVAFTRAQTQSEQSERKVKAS